MNTSTLATLADSSSLLLGLDRKISKVQAEPTSLVPLNPVPGHVSTLGETTREKRNIVFNDGGYQQSSDRFTSEYQFAALPVCDQFDTFGTSSRLVGRNPQIHKL